MNCSSCGGTIRDGGKFCPRCGAPVPETTAGPAPTMTADRATTVNVVNVPPSYGYSVYKMPTKRAWWKMFLLGLITLGIYTTIVKDKMIHELNIAAFKHDGETTLSPMAVSPLMVITLMIYYFVYQHMYMNRLKRELACRNISYSIGPVYFWVMGILLGWTLVCPIILMHKTCKAHNLINADYNMKGE